MKNNQKNGANNAQGKRLQKVVVEPLTKQIRKRSIRGMNMNYLIWRKLKHQEGLLEALAHGIALIIKGQGNGVGKS